MVFAVAVGFAVFFRLVHCCGGGWTNVVISVRGSTAWLRVDIQPACVGGFPFGPACFGEGLRPSVACLGFASGALCVLKFKFCERDTSDARLRVDRMHRHREQV